MTSHDENREWSVFATARRWEVDVSLEQQRRPPKLWVLEITTAKLQLRLRVEGPAVVRRLLGFIEAVMSGPLPPELRLRNALFGEDVRLVADDETKGRIFARCVSSAGCGVYATFLPEDTIALVECLQEMLNQLAMP